MGIMICETHGRVGFVETCSHVAKQIDDCEAPSGPRLAILGDLLVCDECFHSLGFEQFASLSLETELEGDDARWEAFLAAYDAVEGRRAYCLKCVAELEPKRALGGEFEKWSVETLIEVGRIAHELAERHGWNAHKYAAKMAAEALAAGDKEEHDIWKKVELSLTPREQ
jgi:hypothetical protein